MKVLTERLKDGAEVTAYVLDSSASLSNADVRPCVLVLPGGGYLHVSDREAEPVAAAFLAEGINAVVLRYAVGEDVPWQRSFEDGVAGLDWVVENAATLGVDAERIAVVGFSAGGHLAASLGTLATRRPAALVLGYPVITDMFSAEAGKDIPDTAAAVDADTPPTFLFHTVADPRVPVRESLAFLSALDAADVPFEARLYRDGGHGLSLAKAHTANGQAKHVEPAVQTWRPDAVDFLKDVLGEFPVA